MDRLLVAITAAFLDHGGLFRSRKLLPTYCTMKRPVLTLLLPVLLTLSACGGGANDVAQPSGFVPPVLPFVVQLPSDIDPELPLVQSRSAFGLVSSQQVISEIEARNDAEPTRFDWTFLTDQERIDFEDEMETIETLSTVINQWELSNDGFVSSAIYLTGPLTQEVVVFYTEGSAFGEETLALFPTFEFRTVPWARDDLQQAAEQWSAEGLIDPQGVASPILNAGISSSGGLVVIMRDGTDWDAVTPLLGDEARYVTEVIN